jgi:chromate transporter
MLGSSPSPLAPPEPVTLREAFWFWLKLGCIGFGGPAGQIAIMHRELVERRRWISEGRFLHALNYCMVLPGPEATQLAVYIGWLLHGTLGGVVAGVLFVLPGRDPAHPAQFPLYQIRQRWIQGAAFCLASKQRRWR